MKKILIVEDEKALAEEFADWLQFEGYEVIRAYDGKQGLDLALAELPDLILSDIMMPKLSGTQLLYALRAQEVSKMTPFVFLSALSERDHVRNGMILGADDYVSKPVRREELLDTVKCRLERAQETEQYASKSLNELRHNIITHLPHELRTPLNSVIGFGSLLSEMAESFSSKEVSEMGEAILKGGTRLHRLIENYLLYIQIELQHKVVQGQLEAEKLEAVCFDAAFSVAKKYGRENDLSVSVEPCGIGMSDEILRKAITELTDNAFRFSKNNSKIIITGLARPNSFYELTVKDHGIGMYTDDIKRIGAFMQFDRERNEQQGSGLGLVLVQRMVALAGGSMEIKSKKDQWTKVKIQIPQSR